MPPIDLDKLYEEMEERRFDRALETLDKFMGNMTSEERAKGEAAKSVMPDDWPPR